MIREDLFVFVINTLRYGVAQDELSRELNACVQRAQDTGKKATLTLKLTIEPHGHSGQYFVKDEVKTNLPSLPKEQTILFGTPDGNLQREDPRQQTLSLKRVDDDAQPRKNLDTGA